MEWDEWQGATAVRCDQSKQNGPKILRCYCAAILRKTILVGKGQLDLCSRGWTLMIFDQPTIWYGRHGSFLENSSQIEEEFVVAGIAVGAAHDHRSEDRVDDDAGNHIGRQAGGVGEPVGLA